MTKVFILRRGGQKFRLEFDVKGHINSMGWQPDGKLEAEAWEVVRKEMESAEYLISFYENRA